MPSTDSSPREEAGEHKHAAIEQWDTGIALTLVNKGLMGCGQINEKKIFVFCFLCQNFRFHLTHTNGKSLLRVIDRKDWVGVVWAMSNGYGARIYPRDTGCTCCTGWGGEWGQAKKGGTDLLLAQHLGVHKLSLVSLFAAWSVEPSEASAKKFELLMASPTPDQIRAAIACAIVATEGDGRTAWQNSRLAVEP